MGYSHVRPSLIRSNLSLNFRCGPRGGCIGCWHPLVVVCLHCHEYINYIWLDSFKRSRGRQNFIIIIAPYILVAIYFPVYYYMDRKGMES